MQWHHQKARHIKNPSRKLLEGTRLGCNFTPASLCCCSHMTKAPICGEGNRRPEWCRRANFSLLVSLLQGVIFLSAQLRTATDPHRSSAAAAVKPATQTGAGSTASLAVFIRARAAWCHAVDHTLACYVKYLIAQTVFVSVQICSHDADLITRSTRRRIRRPDKVVLLSAAQAQSLSSTTRIQVYTSVNIALVFVVFFCLSPPRRM